MKEIVEALTQFQTQRPTLQEDNTFDALIQYAEEETNELFDAIRNGFSDDEVAREVADAMIFLISAMIEMGRDPKEEIMSKHRRNQAKYPPEYFQDGDYAKSKQMLRDRWREMGGDDVYYCDK